MKINKKCNYKKKDIYFIFKMNMKGFHDRYYQLNIIFLIYQNIIPSRYYDTNLWNIKI